MLYLLALCIPAAKDWANILPSMKYEKSLEIFMIFTALVIVFSEFSQLLFNYIVTLNSVDRDVYFLTRKFRMIVRVASLFLLVPMFNNLRTLNEMSSTKAFVIGVII